MWFRNLRVYRLNRPIAIDVDSIDKQLARTPLKRCGSMEMTSRGWVYPRHDGSFVHAIDRQWLIALGVEQKLLPTTVVRQMAQERAQEIEAAQGRKVGRKELRDLRDRVTEELLPRALTRRRTTWAWIDPTKGRLIVDAGSDARADEVVETLLSSMDDIAPRPLDTAQSPTSAMTEWLLGGEAPAGFSLDSDLELRSANENQAAIRYVRHTLDGKEIQDHIAAGKMATKLGLTWNDRISFVLNEKLQVKRLAFLDILKEEAEQTAESADEQFDVDFVLMAGQVGRMLDDLTTALGGIAGDD